MAKERSVGMQGPGTRFTPGPWRAVDLRAHRTDGDDGYRYWDICSGEEIRSPSEGHVCGYIDCGPTVASTSGAILGEVAEANARLIAAAPDLYAVVEELMESAAYWSDYDVPLGIVDRMKAALAKSQPQGA